MKTKEELISDMLILKTENKELKKKHKERIKELQAIYKINSLMAKPSLSLDTILQKIVECIPQSWQYPQITCARIILEDKEVCTSNFKITKWKQTEKVPVKNFANSIIQVYYLEQKPNEDEGPFLTEERNLLKLIATDLSKIIETKNLENQRFESEEKFSISFQKSPAAKCLVDKSDNFKFLDVNEQFLKLTAFSRAELEGRFLKDINFFSNEVIHSMLIPNVEKQKEIKNLELTFQNKLGEFKTGLLSIEIVKLNTKELVLIVLNDITERKRAELKNYQSEKRFHDIFENMPSGYILFELIYDENGNPIDHRLIEANAEFDVTTGLARNEQIGRTSKQLCWHWPKEVTLAYYKVAMTGKPFAYERFNNSLNRYYDIRVSSPQKGQFALLFNDISKRKEAERERLELLTRFKQTAKHLPGFIYQYHLKKDKTSCFPYASEGIKKIYGVTPEEMMKNAQCVFDVIHPDDLNKISESILESAKNLTKWHQSYRVKLPSGRIIWVDAKSTPIKLKDDSILWHGYAQDITKLINNQNKLIKAKEKAEESDRLKTSFLLNISHEIRTPMNVILGFLDLLNQPKLDEEKRSKFISIVNKSGERLMNTINDIVEISKIEIGDLNINYKDINLFELMNYYYDFFKIKTNEKGLDFEITNQITGSDASVTTDKYKLDSIIMNLINNAIKFTENGKIEIGNYLRNGYVWFYVLDTGIGIPEDKIESIFNRFISVDNSLTRGYEGLGIGLSIVKAYVKALGGSIKVESKQGKGSSFLFSIPHKLIE